MPNSFALDDFGQTQWDSILAYLNENHLGKRMLYKKNGAVFNQEDSADRVYFVLSGKLKVISVDSEGKQFTQRIFSEKSLLGLVPLLIRGRHESSCQAMQNAELLVLSLEDFLALLEGMPSLNYFFLRELATSVRYYAWTSRILSNIGMKERIYACLKRIAYENGVKQPDGSILLDVVLTQENIAEMIGSSRQNVSTQINQMKKEGLLKTENRKIVILKPWF